MSTWFRRSSAAADSPDVATYNALRAASRSWFPKIMGHPAAKRFDIVKAARKVTLPVQDRTIVFKDETESAVLMDYYLFDYRPEGKSLAESCPFAPGELTPLETEIHQANLASRTSLFVVTAVQNHEPKSLLRDRLDPEAPEFWLTDVGFAGSFRRIGGQVLMFLRVVSLHGVHMTGGYSFVFDPKHEGLLVDGYRRDMWSVPLSLQDRRRTAYFLGLHRKFGLAQAYADVVPRSEAEEAR